MIKRFVIVTAILIIGIGCSKSDDGGSDEVPANDFDRKALLNNWADNIIGPIYGDLEIKLSDLVAKKEIFVDTPNKENLNDLRQSWYNAYKVWQYAEMINVGRAEELNFIFQMNVYPTNVSDIQNNIESQSYDLSNVNNNDAVGFPALDYMLYGLADNDTDLLNYYATHSDASKYNKYLSDLIDQMHDLTQDVTSSWSTFKDQFVSATNNNASGSINQLVNDYIFYFEKGLRANKIGIPAGNFSATPLPDRVEAYYRSDISKSLNLEAMTAVQGFFNGKSYSGSSTDSSLKSYLDYLNTIKNGEDLSTIINDQFNSARAKINLLDSNYSQQITTDNTKMTEAYDALQMAVVLLKVDMLQALNISVDYVDADGD